MRAKTNDAQFCCSWWVESWLERRMNNSNGFEYVMSKAEKNYVGKKKESWCFLFVRNINVFSVWNHAVVDPPWTPITIMFSSNLHPRRDKPCKFFRYSTSQPRKRRTPETKKLTWRSRVPFCSSNFFEDVKDVSSSPRAAIFRRHCQQIWQQVDLRLWIFLCMSQNGWYSWYIWYINPQNMQP